MLFLKSKKTIYLKNISKLTYASFFTSAFYYIINQKAIPVISWMNVYGIEEYMEKDLTNFILFLKGLMIPIPINLAILEYFSVKIFGDTRVVTEWLYCVGFVFLFTAPPFLIRKRPFAFFISILISVIFYFSSLKIHIGNPQSYDIFFPLLLLIVILIFKKIESCQIPKSYHFIFFGIIISMLEFMRPFALLFLIPLLVFFIILLKRKKSISIFALFAILPILLLNLPYHIHLYKNHNQLTMTNHSGYNIQRAWPQVMPNRSLEELNAKPTRPGRWPNINTMEHRDNSNYLLSRIFLHIKKHPADSIIHGIKNISNFLFYQYELLNLKPEGCIKILFYIFRFLSYVYLFYQFFLLFKNSIKLVIFNTDALVLILIFLQVILFSLTESGETMRFTIGILPFFALLPKFKFKKSK
ncbi:hypothetical protein [Leptospira bouyouniensis]|uniref:hypothetical protein n=1 Tax=Leptospira bouyouniensis TaxID=2484911 RepID=UPI0010913013|nr:hypothetical protein [Leptospira bouyouniensis]TGM80085.1 hypothetical protein EHQ99_10240 [Leptospira bouyouniensis]